MQRLLLTHNPTRVSLREIESAWMETDDGRKIMKINKNIFIIRGFSNNILYVFSDNPGFAALDIVFSEIEGLKFHTAEYLTFNGTEYNCLEKIIINKTEELEEFLNRNLKKEYYHHKAIFYEEPIPKRNYWGLQDLFSLIVDYPGRI